MLFIPLFRQLPPRAKTVTMTLRTAILSAGLAVFTAASSPPPVASQKITELAGRAPGKPQRCIGGQPGTLFATADSDPHLLLYDDGRTIWTNTLEASCGFEAGQTVIPDESASYYCRGDFVRAGNRITLSPFGQRCSLGNFTPYRSTK
jgi:hypothetical protein